MSRARQRGRVADCANAAQEEGAEGEDRRRSCGGLVPMWESGMGGGRCGEIGAGDGAVGRTLAGSVFAKPK